MANKIGCMDGIDSANTSDKSMHGLLVALGLSRTIAGAVVAFAYTASGGGAFRGVPEALTPDNEKAEASQQQEPAGKVTSYPSISKKFDFSTIPEQETAELQEKSLPKIDIMDHGIVSSNSAVPAPDKSNPILIIMKERP